MGIIEGQRAIVTGSGRGIGRAIALLFAREGARVLVNDVDRTPAEETVAEIREAGGEGTSCPGSVAKAEGANAIVAAAVEAFGGLDILVNNAGNLQDAMVHRMTEEAWQAVLDVHLSGAFHMIRAAAPFMREAAKRELERGEARRRKVVNLSSVTALMGNIGQANYTAAKGGIIALTRTVAREWGPFRINVNCVAPGLIRTRMTAEKREGDELGISRETLEALVSQIPVGRMGEPEEVARVVLFLASPDSDYITGQVIGVTGGLYM